MSSLRTAVHVHSDWSDDGRFALDAIAREFARRDYDAVLMAEHDRGWDDARWAQYVEACDEASTADCLLVPGVEYGDADNTVHVTVWGATPFLGAGRATLDVLRDARALDAVTVLAHPQRRNAISRVTDEWVQLLNGVEVWNRKYDGWAPSRAGIGLAKAHPGLRHFAGNDFHTARQFFPFALVLDAPPTVGGVHEALSSGRYSAEAFGRELDFFTRGITLAAAERIESLRLLAARPVRRIRRLRGRS